MGDDAISAEPLDRLGDGRMQLNQEISIEVALPGFAIAIGNGFAIKCWPSDLGTGSTAQMQSGDSAIGGSEVIVAIDRGSGQKSCD